jgi:hypothetical protein
MSVDSYPLESIGHLVSFFLIQEDFITSPCAFCWLITNLKTLFTLLKTLLKKSQETFFFFFKDVADVFLIVLPVLTNFS